MQASRGMDASRGMQAQAGPSSTADASSGAAKRPRPSDSCFPSFLQDLSPAQVAAYVDTCHSAAETANKGTTDAGDVCVVCNSNRSRYRVYCTACDRTIAPGDTIYIKQQQAGPSSAVPEPPSPVGGHVSDLLCMLMSMLMSMLSSATHAQDVVCKSCVYPTKAQEKERRKLAREQGTNLVQLRRARDEMRVKYPVKTTLTDDIRGGREDMHTCVNCGNSVHRVCAMINVGGGGEDGRSAVCPSCLTGPEGYRYKTVRLAGRVDG